jgi:hypothetical protein
VSSEQAKMQTDNSTLGRVVNERAESGLPLATRNFTQLAALSPGVVTGVFNTGEPGTGGTAFSQISKWWPESGSEPLWSIRICNLHILNSEENAESARIPACAFNLLSNTHGPSYSSGPAIHSRQTADAISLKAAVQPRSGPSEKSLPARSRQSPVSNKMCLQKHDDDSGHSRTAVEITRKGQRLNWGAY